MYKLFIDNIRMPPSNDWMIARSLEDVKQTIKDFGFPNYISFDHDLGPMQPTGLKIAKWLVELGLDYNIIPSTFIFEVHSMNPVGKENIYKYLNNYFNFKKSVV